MRIGIDARFIGPEGTGLGKYTEKLIENLAQIDNKNDYYIFLRQANWGYLKLPANFNKVLADVPWYSLSEQIKLPSIFSSQKLDLLHIPHFNAPIFYRGKFIVTIHDLIHHHFSEQSTSTRNRLIFKAKRSGYRFVIGNAVKSSEKILVPSNFVKEEILKYFKVDPEKIVVTYEAAEEEYFRAKDRNKSSEKSLIYVGNVYPHKNVSTLLDAMKLVDSRLIIVCPRDVFWQRLNQEIKSKALTKKVKMLGYQTPKELTKLFQKSTAYVFPSLSEGFGIPGLNAMATGLPVVCSDIPTLKEVYGEAALYFDPNNPKDIASKLKKILSEGKTRTVLVEKGRKQVKKYSWQKMARLTLEAYNQAAK